MKCAVAIFAKTIGLSEVKTRLAADIGRRSAEAFYKHSKACVEAFVEEARQQRPNALYPVWTVAEEAGPKLYRDSCFSAIWTGEGGLGERLAKVSETLFETHDAVIMIGTDSPQLTPDILITAAEMLQADPGTAVSGPARDGGFYLFGSVEPVPRAIWESVTYSKNTTLTELETQLEKVGRKTVHLVAEQDVDTLEDLSRLKEDLSSRAAQLLAPQTALLDWLEEALSA